MTVTKRARSDSEDIVDGCANSQIKVPPVCWEQRPHRPQPCVVVEELPE
jgi:hypothetical protein